MTPEHFRALAHALKLMKPSQIDYKSGFAFSLANRQWIAAVRLQADVCAAYGFTRNAFLDACDFDA